VRREVLASLEPTTADLRGATWTASDRYELEAGARRFELWEYDVAGRLGLKEAVDHLLDLGVPAVERTVRANAAYLRSLLGELPGVVVRDVGPDLSGIVSFTVAGVDAEAVRNALAREQVTVTVSEVASTRLDMTARGLTSVVRASPHYFVSPEDLERAAEAVASVSLAG